MVEGLTGNVNIESDKQIYVSLFGRNGDASFGGFYSGFVFDPEINLIKINPTGDLCLGNIKLEVSSITDFETYQWYKDGNPIPGANQNTYSPTEPGYYKVEGNFPCEEAIRTSLEIPISYCPSDFDTDSIPDDIDEDRDNDGIFNCQESLGSEALNLSNLMSGQTFIDNNTYAGQIVTDTNLNATWQGNNSGKIEISSGPNIDNQTAYQINFNKALNINISYANTIPSANWLDNNEKITLTVDKNKTITIYDPDDQLLIDQNHDGIYDSNTTLISGFEVKFTLKNTLLNPADATFKIQTHQTNTLKISYQNTDEFNSNKLTLGLESICIQANHDSDNQSSDKDLDSDNDGCFDVVEAGYSDTNNDGILDGPGVNNLGLVVPSDGYQTDIDEHFKNYQSIIVTSQPSDIISCANSSMLFYVGSDADYFQWEVSEDNGLSWNNVNNSPLQWCTNRNITHLNGTLQPQSEYVSIEND